MADKDDTRAEQEKLLGPTRYWQGELDKASQFERDWRERSMRVVERYRDERGSGTRGPLSSRFNILWANTETLKGALFARMAQPDVRRRFPDPNPAARQVAILIERTLSYDLDIYDSARPLMAALEDLEAVYNRLKDDPQFRADFDYDMAHYVGRPSPLYFAERLTKKLAVRRSGSSGKT